MLEKAFISPEIKGFGHVCFSRFLSYALWVGLSFRFFCSHLQVSGDLLAAPCDVCPSFLNVHLRNSIVKSPRCFGSIIRMLSDVREEETGRASRKIHFLLVIVSIMQSLARHREFDISKRHSILSPLWIQYLLDKINNPVEVEAMQF